MFDKIVYNIQNSHVLLLIGIDVMAALLFLSLGLYVWRRSKPLNNALNAVTEMELLVSTLEQKRVKHKEDMQVCLQAIDEFVGREAEWESDRKALEVAMHTLRTRQLEITNLKERLGISIGETGEVSLEMLGGDSPGRFSK